MWSDAANGVGHSHTTIRLSWNPTIRHSQRHPTKSNVEVPTLSGARELLAYLTSVGVPWAIATSGDPATVRPALSGGYGQDELERAGAYRVYQDPTNLLKHLYEVVVCVAE